MQIVDALHRLWTSLLSLGGRRLGALALAGVTVFLLVAISGYMLSRPRQEILYGGLDRQDVTRIGAVLGDVGIAFDVNVAGDAVLVEYGQAAKGRMILAQKGLPRSDSAGYELFDKLGSLGLTTFMQQITKVRALEGELARTIQLIDGIKAARVHLALRSENSFRRQTERATASVIIRADQNTGRMAANAIRHLVASAISGLSPDQVTVMGAGGVLLASEDDSISAAPSKLIGLERSMAGDIEDKISRTIAPYVGVGNFRVSASAKLNADKRQVSEMAFDPNSRVERSIRVVKESGEAENAAGSDTVSVDQNIPAEETPRAGGDNSRERKDRKEELTNYEINSKSTSTTSEGYVIDLLSIAIVVNRTRLADLLGADPSAEAIGEKVLEIEQLAASAVGLVASRGDSIKVIAVPFLDEAAELPPVGGVDVLELIGGNLGSLINAFALIVVSVLVLLLGLRPALRFVLDAPSVEHVAGAGELPDFSGTAAEGHKSSSGDDAGKDVQRIADHGYSPALDGLAREISTGPRDRLAKIVELDPDRAAQVLKQWLNEPSGNVS